LLSAYQAALFNDYLDARQDEGLLSKVIDGDILQKRQTGGMFGADSHEVVIEAQARLDAGELSITGPIFGSKMKFPHAGSAAQVRENLILMKEEISPESFKPFGPIAEGTRRPLLVPVSLPEEGPAVTRHESDDQALIVRFSLPPGSYATMVLAEVIKDDAASLGDTEASLETDSP
jgi:tRNA pseudouridine13 synthase